MDCYICNLLKQNTELIYKFAQGSVYLHENQFFHGRIFYALNHHWRDISEVPTNIFIQTCADLQILTKAVQIAFKPDLINIASLGNYAAHVHWHIIPRYKDDPCWGKPPWPHGEKILHPDDYGNLNKTMHDIINHLIE